MTTVPCYYGGSSYGPASHYGRCPGHGTGPEVVDQNPAPGDTNVDPSAPVEFAVIDDSQVADVNAWIRGELIYNGSSFTAGWLSSTCTPDIARHGFVFSCVPDIPWGVDEVVPVRVWGEDSEGLEVDVSYAFSAGLSFQCFDVSGYRMPSLLLLPEVTASRGVPWFSFDGNDLVMVSNDGILSTLRISLPISSTFTFETTFKVSELPLDLTQLDVDRFFVGTFDKQDNAGGVLLSRSGLALVAAFGSSAVVIPGSQTLFEEGETYYTMRMVVQGDTDQYDLYFTKTLDLPITGHQLRYTSAAPVSPSGSMDEVRIEILGQAAGQSIGKFSSLRVSCDTAIIPNRRPIADAGADQASNTGSAVVHDGRNSYDPEGATLTYAWALVGAPIGSRFEIFGGEGSTTDDGDADGFTDIFNGGSEVFSVANAPLLQPGDHLLVSDVLYKVSTTRWVYDSETGKYTRNPGSWDDDEIVITEETLPDDLSEVSWSVFHTSTYFSDPLQSFPSAIPDVIGLYRVQLVVNDGELDSLPDEALLNVLVTSVPLGCIPDLRWVWNFLSDFWNLLEDREAVETVWSGFAQAAAAQLLSAWQIDYNKSLKDIQRIFQRRWLSYSTVLEDPEADKATIRIIRGKLVSRNLALGVTFTTGLNDTLQLILDAGGIETVTFPPGLLTASQIAVQINTQLGFATSQTPLASTVTFGAEVYLILDYAALLRIRPNGLANSALGFSATEYTNNDLGGLSGGPVLPTKLRAFEAYNPPVLDFDEENIGNIDLLVFGSNSYRIQKTALDASTSAKTTGLSLLDDLPDMGLGGSSVWGTFVWGVGVWGGSGGGGATDAWKVPSVVVSAGLDFEEALVLPGDLVSFEVKDLTSTTGDATVVVRCLVVGAKANRVGFDPQPLLEKLNGYPSNYRVSFSGIKRTQTIPVSDLVVGVPRLQEVIKEPPVTFGQNTDYTIDDTLGSNAIQFRSGTFSLGDPPPDTFWAEVTYLDNRPAIEANFGRMVNFKIEDLATRTEDLDYLSAVRGLWWAYFGGPSLYKVRVGCQILLGLPFAEEKGVIQSIEANFSAVEGRIVIRDALDATLLRTYFYPLTAGLAVNESTGAEIAEGDAIEQFAPLSGGIETRDYIQTASWMARYVSMGKYGELEKYFKFLIRGNADTFSLVNMAFAIDFVKKIKPNYTYPIFVVLKQLRDTEVDISDSYVINVTLSLVDTFCSRLEPGSYRWDDTNEGRPGPPGTHVTVQPGVQGLPTNWIHMYDATPGSGPTPFAYDRHRLCPDMTVWFVTIP